MFKYFLNLIYVLSKLSKLEVDLADRSIITKATTTTSTTTLPNAVLIKQETPARLVNNPVILLGTTLIPASFSVLIDFKFLQNSTGMHPLLRLTALQPSPDLFFSALGFPGPGCVVGTRYGANYWVLSNGTIHLSYVQITDTTVGAELTRQSFAFFYNSSLVGGSMDVFLGKEGYTNTGNITNQFFILRDTTNTECSNFDCIVQENYNSLGLN